MISEHKLIVYLVWLGIGILISILTSLFSIAKLWAQNKLLRDTLRTIIVMSSACEKMSADTAKRCPALMSVTELLKLIGEQKPIAFHFGYLGFVKRTLANLLRHNKIKI